MKGRSQGQKIQGFFLALLVRMTTVVALGTVVREKQTRYREAIQGKNSETVFHHLQKAF
jgi:hypothetical protein